MEMDCYEELGVERRLTWSEEELRGRYDVRCREVHPDSGSGDAEAFQRLGRAYAILRSPGQRLRHWLETGGEGWREGGRMPEEVTDLFGELGELLPLVDDVIARKEAAQSALARSMAEREGIALMKRVEKAREKTSSLGKRLQVRFPGFDAEGAEECHEEAMPVARGLLFLEKWERELRERWARLV